MLILIAGVTGNLGQKLIDSLDSRGHKIRGLGRTPSKLDSSRKGKLESFVQSKNYYDIPAINGACKGVDAVICAYAALPELSLDGQLILLRAAERAGIKKYVAASWNANWKNMLLGVHEGYDPFISFRNQAELTSDIKPIYLFTGVLAEILFEDHPGHGDFEADDNGGAWDSKRKAMNVWGTGKEIAWWTTERDAAEFTAAVIERDDAANGGFWSVCSGHGTLEEIAKTYGKVRNCEVAIKKRGSVDELRKVALEARSKGSKRFFWHYIGYFYQLISIDGSAALGELDNDKLDVKTTSLEEFLQQNPQL